MMMILMIHDDDDDDIMRQLTPDYDLFVLQNFTSRLQALFHKLGNKEIAISLVYFDLLFTISDVFLLGFRTRWVI